MRVLHVISNLDPRAGGTTAAVGAIAEAQQAAGLDVAVVSTSLSDFQSVTTDRLRSVGVDVTIVEPHGRVRAARILRPILHDLIAQADVVHIHAVWEEIQHQAAAVARRLRKPYIFTPHGMLDPWSMAQSRLKKLLYFELRLRRDLNLASAVHFTDEIERDHARRLNLKSSPIVEGLIIDLSDFQPAPAPGQFRARFAAQLGDRPIVLFMSRIHPKKGLDLLIPAFASIANATNAMLVIGGPQADGYQAVVEQMSRDYGIHDRVIFPGMLNGTARATALVDADLFVLPSYQENFGVVVIEALAVGTPVIISDQVAIHRKITDSQSGEVVRTNVESLTAALLKWTNDPELRRAASQNAIRFVAEKFDRQQQAARWIWHYTQLQASQ